MKRRQYYTYKREIDKWARMSDKEKKQRNKRVRKGQREREKEREKEKQCEQMETGCVNNTPKSHRCLLSPECYSNMRL